MMNKLDCQIDKWAMSSPAGKESSFQSWRPDNAYQFKLQSSESNNRKELFKIKKKELEW
jgi:hypothetical protein